MQAILDSFKGMQLSEIEPVFPHFIFGEGLSLQIDCPWRIMHGSIMIAGNIDYRSKSEHEQLLQELEDYLIGQKITSIRANQHPCDLILKLGDTTTIQLFQTSALHESWRLIFGEQAIVGSGNGELSTLP